MIMALIIMKFSASVKQTVDNLWDNLAATTLVRLVKNG